MNTYEHEGVVFYLDSTYQDVFGGEWAWAGQWSPAKEPLMKATSVHSDCMALVPLPDVYRDHGPLIRLAGRSTAAQRRAAVDVDPDYAASVAAGFVESPAAFAARITVPAAPAPAASLPVAAGQAFTSPLESRGFRAFLKTLKGTRHA